MKKKTVFKIVVFLALTVFVKCGEKLFESYPAIKLSSVIVNVSEFGGNDGAIDLTLTGGMPPFVFLWSDNKKTEDLDSLTAGIYSVIIEDSKKQILKDTFEVTEPEPGPLVLEIEITYPSETGASDGALNAVVSGGYPPYCFLWSNTSTSQNISGLAVGIYRVTVTDKKGQNLTDSVALISGVTDIDGNSYSTVKIGEQIWMKENLRVTHAPDGTEIESYAYNNDPNNSTIYGRLYSWDAAMNGATKEEAQGICPCGWHIPDDEEYKILEMFLGMTQQEADMVNVWRGANIGTKLKMGGSARFDAKLSGRRLPSGGFSLLGQVEYLWTSTEYEDYAWRRCLDISANSVGRWNTFPKSYFFSVRCIKDK